MASGGKDTQGAVSLGKDEGWSKSRRNERECFNCHEVGHLRQDCVNEKRVKCFNCDGIGHVQRDCKEPEKVRLRTDKMAWDENGRRGEMIKKMITAKGERTHSGMTVVQAFLEVDQGKMGQVRRELGIKILEILGLDVKQVVGQDKEVRGI